ncbi:MAG TPA: hypothetical protein VG798_05365 [Rhizomicrobium sp.]|nr:hypothetical protein [Rhizomicrobium sp.]
MAQLAALGRHTVTGLLTAQNRQQQDWTADYRFYSRERVQPEALFATARKVVEANLPAAVPFVVALDDSLLPKTGRRMAGAAWRRDPQGPPFQVQFTWAQRVLQFSAARPLGPEGAVRLVPIDFLHAPTPTKPRKGDDAAAQAAYVEAAKQANLVALAQRRLVALRQQVPASRSLHLVGDGRYSNRTLLRQTPPGTIYIGRLRKDSALFNPPPAQPATGRKRIYGAQTLTPEQLRQAEDRPWQAVRAYACGKLHDFKVKVLPDVRTPLCGERPVQVVVIAPLGYRPRKGSKLLYRQPAYLLCTDPRLAVEQVLQEYLWRWDIEVNFREEKTLLGVGQAQVRHPAAVANVPALAVGTYALLQLAALAAYGDTGQPTAVPLPRWRRFHPPARATTARLINQLRHELWAAALRPESLAGFTASSPPDQKPEKLSPHLASSLFYATN